MRIIKDCGIDKLSKAITPIIKNKGSAIFLHIAKKNYKKTAGCIALKKADLIYLVRKINKNIKVHINYKWFSFY